MRELSAPHRPAVARYTGRDGSQAAGHPGCQPGRSGAVTGGSSEGPPPPSASGDAQRGGPRAAAPGKAVTSGRRPSGAMGLRGDRLTLPLPERCRPVGFPAGPAQGSGRASSSETTSPSSGRCFVSLRPPAKPNPPAAAPGY